MSSQALPHAWQVRLVGLVLVCVALVATPSGQTAASTSPARQYAWAARCPTADNTISTMHACAACDAMLGTPHASYFNRSLLLGNSREHCRLDCDAAVLQLPGKPASALLLSANVTFATPVQVDASGISFRLWERLGSGFVEAVVLRNPARDAVLVWKGFDPTGRSAIVASSAVVLWTC